MNYKKLIPTLELDFYDPAHDSEGDHVDPYKCNNQCGENVEIDGDVCQTCYDAE